MDMLIAEDLLLLLLDDHTGRVSAFFQHSTPLLGGGLLAQLALDGSVRVEEKQGFLHWPKVLTVPPTATATPDPLLANAWNVVAQKPRTAASLVDRLGRGLRPGLHERLVERGILTQQPHKVLGVFPTSAWPAQDSTHERGVTERIRGVLVHGLTPDPRTRTLISLLHAAGLAHRVVDHDGVDTREVKRRAAALSSGDWVAKGVKDAIQAAQSST